MTKRKKNLIIAISLFFIFLFGWGILPPWILPLFLLTGVVYVIMKIRSARKLKEVPVEEDKSEDTRSSRKNPPLFAILISILVTLVVGASLIPVIIDSINTSVEEGSVESSLLEVLPIIFVAVLVLGVIAWIVGTD